MTEHYIDDVTGERIGGDTERWWRLHGLPAQYSADISDLDTLLEIIRDHVTSDSPAPLDIATLRRVPGDKPPALAKYAPADEEPQIPEDDAPFGPIRKFKIGGFGAPAPKFTFLSSLSPMPARPAAADNPDLLARVDKARDRYVRRLAEACGCNDFAAHERNLP